MKRHLKVLGEYIGHLAVGSLMFAALLLFGGALNRLVHWFTPLIGDSTFTDLMKLVERAMLYADVVFIVYWTLCSTYKALKELMK